MLTTEEAGNLSMAFIETDVGYPYVTIPGLQHPAGMRVETVVLMILALKAVLGPTSGWAGVLTPRAKDL